MRTSTQCGNRTCLFVPDIKHHRIRRLRKVCLAQKIVAAGKTDSLPVLLRPAGTYLLTPCARLTAKLRGG